MATVFVYLITYYFRLRAENVNKIMNDLIINDQLSGHQISSAVKEFISKHNQICAQLWSYDKFWKKLYLSFVLTMIPMNLCLLHEILFEEFEIYDKIFLGFTLIIQMIIIFFFQLLTASLSSKIHIGGKKLSRLQWKINGWPFRTRIKIKLLACFERLSSNRKIGFSIGSIAVVTFPLFYKVIVVTIFLRILQKLNKIFFIS